LDLVRFHISLFLFCYLIAVLFRLAGIRTTGTSLASQARE
jgi:hypothetical protein